MRDSMGDKAQILGVMEGREPRKLKKPRNVKGGGLRAENLLARLEGEAVGGT